MSIFLLIAQNAPQTLKNMKNPGFCLGGAPHKVALLRRPSNSYKTPAKPQMYTHTHTLSLSLTHTHTPTHTNTHTHTHTHTQHTQRHLRPHREKERERERERERASDEYSLVRFYKNRVLGKDIGP